MKYTKPFLAKIVEESTSMQQVFQKIGGRGGGNGSYLYKKIKKFGIDTSHFISVGRGKKATDLSDVLSNKVKMNSHTLKNRLIEEGIKAKMCERCTLTHWMGFEMSLELHHLDEDHDNNSLENLQILCPNCHWTAHHEINEAKKKQKEDSKTPKFIAEGNQRVASPKPEYRRVERPTLEELESNIKELGYVGCGRIYGVSDNCIRKWVKIYKKYVVV